MSIPVELTVPTVVLFTMKDIVSFVGCTVNLVVLSSDDTAPNVNTD